MCLQLIVKGLVFLAVFSSVGHADWLRFRGPNGSGVSQEPNPTPVTWSPGKLKWKVALPGPGSSCPIVVGGKAFVTCWSGYALDKDGDPGDQSALRRHLLCIDANTGKVDWNKEVAPVLPEDRYGGMFSEHGYASHSPVSDGERVFVFFGKSGVLAFDLQGNQLWQTSVGTESGARNWGTASSPILYKDLVIVPATAESEAVVALDKENGREVWRAEAAGFNSTWGSPVLADMDGQTEVVIAIPGEIWGLNADTGKLKWYSEAVPAASMCSSAVVDENGVVYALESGPGGGGGVAIRAGGKKDVSDTHTVWSGRQSNRISTPLVYEGRLYTIANKIVTCLDTETGEEIFKGRLSGSSSSQQSESEPPRGETRGGRSDFGGGERGGFGAGGRRGRGGRGGQDYGSPILANGKIYYTTRAGDTFVLKASDELEQIAVNRVTNDTEDFSATPAISGGALFIRSDKHLYCVSDG